MGHARAKPQHLASKLLAIRKRLGVSQSEMAKLLKFNKGVARLSEYESGTREPALITLLAYAHLVGIHVDDLIDDAVDLPAQIRIKQQRKRVTLFAS